MGSTISVRFSFSLFLLKLRYFFFEVLAGITSHSSQWWGASALSVECFEESLGNTEVSSVMIHTHILILTSVKSYTCYGARVNT